MHISPFATLHSSLFKKICVMEQETEMIADEDLVNPYETESGGGCNGKHASKLWSMQARITTSPSEL